MSEPIKKPHQNPESFNPQKPEIVNMMDEAGNITAKQLETASGLLNFEIVKFGPYRFIGRSVYARAWGERDFIEFLWKQGDSIFKTLDGMKEYASDDSCNAGMRHWEIYGGDGITHWDEVFFKTQTELLGYTVGRFMKADTPVPEGMQYIDIHEMYVAKTWMKGKPGDKVGMIDEGLVYDGIDRMGYKYVPIFSAEIYPISDENGVPVFGSYVACRPLTGQDKEVWENEKQAAEESKKSKHVLIGSLEKMIPNGESVEMKITNDDASGVWRQGTKTEQSFELPINIKLHAKVNDNGVRFEYGKGNMMFFQECMRMHEIADGRSCVFNECGGIPTGDEFVDIEWILGKEFMAIKINGELRHIGNNYKYIREFKENPEYSLSSPVTIAAAAGSTVTVEKLRAAKI